MKKSKLILIGLSIVFAQSAIGQGLTQKALERAAKMKAKNMAKIEGDNGRVIVYSDEARTKEVSDITGLTKIYCSANPHSKQVSKAQGNKRSRFGVYVSENCNFSTSSSTKACKEYWVQGDEVSEWSEKDAVEFEIDLVEVFERALNSNEKEMTIRVILDGGSNNSVRMAMSHELLFNIEKSRVELTKMVAEKNKNVKPGTAAFEDANLESKVKGMLSSRNYSNITDFAFTTNWDVTYKSAGNPEHRKTITECYATDSDGVCYVLTFTVWEDYTGTKFQMSSNPDEAINRFGQIPVPCR